MFLRSEAAYYNKPDLKDYQHTTAFGFLVVFLMIAGFKNWVFSMKHYTVAKTLRFQLFHEPLPGQNIKTLYYCMVVVAVLLPALMMIAYVSELETSVILGLYISWVLVVSSSGIFYFRSF